MSAILWGGALIAVPIVVHLWHRQKTVPIQWGAMQFLLETPLKLRRKQRIDHWLLMLVRMAVLLLLAMLLARPIIEGVSYSSSTPMDVVVVLDHSLSMGQRASGAEGGGGGGTLFDDSVRTLERIADMLPRNTGTGSSATLGVVLAEHAPRVMTPIPVVLGSGDDYPKLLQRLRETKPGMSDANIPAAVQAAVELSARGRNLHKVIVVISDDQRANWYPADDARWRLTSAGKHATSTEPAIPIYSIPVSPNTAAPNISVGRLSVAPAFLGIQRPAQITAAVTNTGAANLANIPLRLVVDGRDVPNGSQQIAQLAPSQSVTVRFEHYFADAGSHWVRLQSDLVDGLLPDNAATTAVTVAPRLPILIVDGQRTPAASYPAAAFLTLAMQPGGGGERNGANSFLQPKIISVAEFPGISFEQYPIVILNDIPRLPTETVARLTTHVQQGNGLWIILGARTEESFLNNVLAKGPLFSAIAKPPVAIPSAAAPMGIDIKEPDHPTLAVITASQQNALAGASLRAWWPIAPTPSMRTILATTAPAGQSSGDPLVTEVVLGNTPNAPGGRVIVWTSSVSNINWNNLPFLPNFVPLVNETLFHLASQAAAGRQRQLDAGQPLLWSGPIRPLIESATLVVPDATVRTLQPQLRGDKYLITDNDTSLPGIYELRFKPAEIPQPVFFSVNVDPAELNPATLAASEIEWLREQRYLTDRLTLEQFPNALNARLTGFELWWPATILLFILLVVEVVMTWRLARKQTDIDPANAGLIAPSTRASISAGVLR